MSKKKATMTLKDFHGGSIPSDLPLPSAPGVIVRPTDRIGFDRQTPWGNPIGRPDHRLRPGSAGTPRNFDDKTPFLTPTSRIGRNFDEDERKPLDGGSAPRRTVSDDSIRALPTRVEPQPHYSSPERVSGRPSSTPYPVHVNESRPVGLNVNHQSISGLGGPQPNAWGLRKEAVILTEPAPASWSAPDAAVKLAHASALEKVSSGRWHSKQPVHHHVDVEVITHSKSFNDSMVVRHVEVIAPVAVYESATTSPIYSERKPQIYADVPHPPRNAQPPVVSESLERPKLKLLPRSKPAENVESSFDSKQQGQQQTNNTRGIANVTETNENSYPAKPVVGGTDDVNRVVERPKLSLKPRSQPHEQLDLEGNTKKERNSLFGGARPREFVLKERGIDDVVLTNQNLSQSPNKVKPDIPWTETVPARSTPNHHYNEKVNSTPLDHRIGKNIERRDYKGNNAEKSDAQRRNWRNENRHHQQQQQQQQAAQPQPPLERPRSPETWRKPIEQPPSPSRDPPGSRYRKGASAVELAQAFSRSVSDPRKADRFSSGQRGLPGRAEIPFSRLTGPQPRPQINGY